MDASVFGLRSKNATASKEERLNSHLKRKISPNWCQAIFPGRVAIDDLPICDALSGSEPYRKSTFGVPYDR
jgi:hypothetical protein